MLEQKRDMNLKGNMEFRTVCTIGLFLGMFLLRKNFKYLRTGLNI